jgi:hypothetical protein
MEDYRFRRALKRAANEGEALALKFRAGLTTIDEARAAVRESRRETSRPRPTRSGGDRPSRRSRRPSGRHKPGGS